MVQKSIPEELRNPGEVFTGGKFMTAMNLASWMYSEFIQEGGRLENEEHKHLRDARIVVLLTNVPNKKKGRVIIGQAEKPSTNGDAWSVGRRMQQIRDWFGTFPDFIITLYTPYVYQAETLEFCGLVEHELYHCAQALDDFGSPRFSKDTGDPIFVIKGHDVEEFIGVVERYGAYSPELRRMVDAATQPGDNKLKSATIAASCGTCSSAILG